MTRKVLATILSVATFMAVSAEEKKEEHKWEYVGRFDDGAKVFIDILNVVKADQRVGTFIKIYPDGKRYNQLKQEMIKLYEETERETGFKANVDIEKIVDAMMDAESNICAVRTNCKFEKVEALCNGLFFEIPLPKEDDEKNVYYKIEKYLCVDRKEK